jgi:hypothetical protein
LSADELAVDCGPVYIDDKIAAQYDPEIGLFGSQLFQSFVID